MIWKVVVVLTIALCVQGEEDAISEQRVVIHHKKSFRCGSLSHSGSNKSGNQDEYVQAYPSYEFSYNVNDPKTHDIKGQHEKGEGDEVTGNYWLIEPNGRKRTVNYQAKDDSGFNAQIVYTASLKGKERSEDVSGNQGNMEQSNIAENNEEAVEIAEVEEIEDTQYSKDESGENNNPSPVVENNLSDQDESDNQKDEAINVSNIDRNGERSFAKNIQENENTNNQENNERNLSKFRTRNKAINDAEKDKRESSKHINNYNHVRNGNENNRKNLDRPKNNKRVRQNNLKQNENNNRNSHKRKKSNRYTNTHNQDNISNNDSNITVNKGQINANQEKNVRKQNGFRKKENNNYNEQNDNLNNKNYARSDEIQRKVDIPDNEETFEHRIRIYHPKNVLTTLKKEQSRN